MTTLRPLKDNILFTWLDGEEDETTTASGIVLTRDLNKERNRWGRIIAVGPHSTARVGEFILCDNHVEPYGAKHPDDKRTDRNEARDVWRVRDENVLCVTDDYNVTMPLNDGRDHTKMKDWETLNQTEYETNYDIVD